MKVDEFAKKLNLFFTEVETATLERLNEDSRKVAAQIADANVPMHNHSLKISDPPAARREQTAARLDSRTKI